MKNLPKIVLALTAFAALGASAQTVYSGQSDQERRERNREEALSTYRANNPSTAPMTTEERKGRVRAKTHEAAESTRRGAHNVAESTRRVTHKSANAVRRAGHKTAVKARDFTDRTNAKFGTAPKGNANPDGINPVGTKSSSPTAPSNGTTK